MFTASNTYKINIIHVAYTKGKEKAFIRLYVSEMKTLTVKAYYLL